MLAPMTSPKLILKHYRAQERELLKEVETARLLKGARAYWPQRRDHFLASIGGILADISHFRLLAP